MTIKDLEINGLYGYINKKITFYNDINLLVGINGSGKTSVLNVINWLLIPAYGELCVTEFTNIKMTFILNDLEYEIQCSHSEGKFEYRIKSEDKEYYPLTYTIQTPPSTIRNNEYMKDKHAATYNAMSPDKMEYETMRFLTTQIPKPMNVGLDRGISKSDIFGENEEFNRKEKVARSKNSNNMPLSHIKNLVNTQYRKKKNSISNLNNYLRNQLVLSAFEGNITRNSLAQTQTNPITIDQVEAVEQGLYKYFSDIDSSLSHKNQNNVIKKYFTQIKQVIRNYETSREGNSENDRKIDEIVFSLNAKQFHKLTNILAEFKKFEDQSAVIMRQINIFLETTNSFFKDSSKHLLFKEDTSELCFNAVTKDNKKVIAKYQDINYLSSGEKQLLILFSYLAFNGSHNKIFIIDEPELSLHIRWQEDFLDAIAKVSPEGTQVILATHSPIIASKKKSKAILLYPYNAQ